MGIGLIIDVAKEVIGSSVHLHLRKQLKEVRETNSQLEDELKQNRQSLDLCRTRAERLREIVDNLRNAEKVLAEECNKARQERDELYREKVGASLASDTVDDNPYAPTETEALHVLKVEMFEAVKKQLVEAKQQLGDAKRRSATNFLAYIDAVEQVTSGSPSYTFAGLNDMFAEFLAEVLAEES